jgi:hypothetical protein
LLFLRDRRAQIGVQVRRPIHRGEPTVPRAGWKMPDIELVKQQRDGVMTPVWALGRTPALTIFNDRLGVP